MRILLFFLSLFITTFSYGQNLEAYFNLTRFNVPGGEPFIDVFISFNGRTVSYVDDKAKVESTIIVKDGDHIVDFRKTSVESPFVETDSIPNDFVDVQRFSLRNGKYSIEIILRDLNLLNADTIKFSYPFELFFSGNQVGVSDIELVERMELSDEVNLFSKAGYQIIPFVSDYYRPNRNELLFYSEVYNSDKKFGADNQYLVVAQIANSGGEVVGNYRKMLRKTTAPVTVVLSRFDISELYSGTYQLQIEVRDKENKLIKSNSFNFFRNNPPPYSDALNPDSLLEGEVLFTQMIPDREVLLEYIRSMWPRAEQLEKNIINNQISSASTEDLQNFMYTFWYKRDAKAPQEAWDKYHDLVKTANELFSTQIRKGYETDRGRIFLQYGKPNKLIDIPSEPSAYPYQIWHYYHIDRYSNIRFVFYSRELSSNDYTILHSDMRGEIYNRRWEAELYSRTDPLNSIDNNYAAPSEGSRALDYYNNPR